MRRIIYCLLIFCLASCSEPKAPRGVARVIARNPNRNNSAKPSKPVQGDSFANEFVKIGEEIIEQLISTDQSEVDGVSVKNLETTIRQTEVKSVEAVLYSPERAANFVHPLCVGQDLNPEGQDWKRVDSVSCSIQKKIFLSLVNWKSLGVVEKRRLVLRAYIEVLNQKSSL
jgi:hypothetical protein